MKFNKLFSVFALSMVTLCMSAAITSKATIKVASSYGPADYLYLKVDPAETELVDDILNNVNEASVNFYAVIGSNNYSSVKQAGLGNLKLVFVANSLEESYTVSFSDVLGEITLANADTSFVIDATKTYTINCAKSATVEFTVNPSPEYNYTRDIATGKWGTICFPEAITEVVGATIYQFTSLSGDQVAADVVNTPLEKGKAYLFLATADAQGFNYTDATQATSAVANNGLVGTFVDYTSTEDAPYVIKGNSLVPASPAKVPAFRAYIPKLSDIPTATAPARAGRKIFNVVGGTTGFEAVEAAPAMEGKMMINGKLVIIKGGKMYNAQGAAL